MGRTPSSPPLLPHLGLVILCPPLALHRHFWLPGLWLCAHHLQLPLLRFLQPGRVGAQLPGLCAVSAGLGLGDLEAAGVRTAGAAFLCCPAGVCPSCSGHRDVSCSVTCQHSKQSSSSCSTLHPMAFCLVHPSHVLASLTNSVGHRGCCFQFSCTLLHNLLESPAQK